MLIPELRQVFPIQNAIVVVHNSFVGDISKFPAEPLVEWNRKPLFSPIKNVSWQDRLERFLKDIFSRIAMKLQMGRDGRDHFHQLVVKNRSAQFQRNGHTSAIYLSK